MRTVMAALLLLAGVSVRAADGLIAQGADLEEVVTGLGMPDGPAWDGKLLWFPDVKKQQLYKYDPATQQTTLVLDKAGIISATAMDHRNRLMLSEHLLGRISRFEGEAVAPVVQHDEHTPPRRPNDLAVARDGGIYHTLTATDEVWYTSTDGSRSLAVARVPRPNGIALSPDGKTLYVSAFLDKKIHAFPVQPDGLLGPGTIFASADDGLKESGADGLTCDSAGNVYCTLPRSIRVWDPRGAPLATIEIPKKPINCEFGDADGKSLYITAGDSIYRLRIR
jgi:sugar lactone lactonase YvrE